MIPEPISLWEIIIAPFVWCAIKWEWTKGAKGVAVVWLCLSGIVLWKILSTRGGAF